MLLQWVQKNGLTALHMAAASDGIEVAAMLLSRGADVNATDLQLMTPLHYAAIFGNPNVCKFLLDQVLLIMVECA